MPVNFSGSWTIDKHDSCDALIELLQIPEDKQPTFPITNLSAVIKQDGDDFLITSTSAGGSHEYSFKVGTTFETHLAGWLPKMKVTATWEGDRLVYTEEHGLKLVREILEDQLVTTIIKDDISVKVYYNRA